MRKRIQRPSPALVLSVVALFVALGGTGYAAVKINGKNIKNGTVTGKKLKNKTVTGGKVKSNSLTGTQINEAKLGTVPSATKADSATNAVNAATAANAANAVNAANAANAATVGGSSVDGFSFAADTGSGEFGTIGSVGGVSLQASCNGAGSLGLRVVSDAPSSIHTTLIGSDNAPAGFTNTDVAANSPISLFGSGDQDRIGWIVVTRPGNVVTVQYSSEQDGGTSECEAAGTMVSAPTS